MFSFELLFFIISLILLLICSFLDLKYREFSNKLLLTFFITAVILQLINAIVLKSASSILQLALSIILTAVVGFILWTFGVFAGGDLKLFIVLSSLNIYNLNIIVLFLGQGFVSNKFMLIYFTLILIILSLLTTIPYLLLYSIVELFSKRYYKDIFNYFRNKQVLLSIVISVASLFLLNIV
ncbi:MAG: prepilin peptidase, partial [archaeon]